MLLREHLERLLPRRGDERHLGTVCLLVRAERHDARDLVDGDCVVGVAHVTSVLVDTSVVAVCAICRDGCERSGGMGMGKEWGKRKGECESYMMSGSGETIGNRKRIKMGKEWDRKEWKMGKNEEWERMKMLEVNVIANGVRVWRERY